jgi:hypothetical protein
MLEIERGNIIMTAQRYTSQSDDTPQHGVHMARCSCFTLTVINVKDNRQMAKCLPHIKRQATIFHKRRGSAIIWFLRQKVM